MSKPTIDLTGKRFGRLVVIEKSESTQDKKVRWLCQCDCGNQCIVRATCLLRKDFTKSCGCIKREVASETYKKIGTNSKKHNIYDLTGLFGIGYTLKGEEFYFDLEDYDKIKDYYWLKTEYGYIHSTNRKDKQYVFLHRLVMNINDPEIICDHINCNKIDNRKNNLRIATRSGNATNRPPYEKSVSGYSGVTFDKTKNKWLVRIYINHKQVNLGCYDNLDEAIAKPLKAEEKYYGEFSYNRSNQE